MANTPGTGNRRDPDMLSEPDPQLFDYEEGYHGRLFDAVFSIEEALVDQMIDPSTDPAASKYEQSPIMQGRYPTTSPSTDSSVTPHRQSPLTQDAYANWDFSQGPEQQGIGNNFIAAPEPRVIRRGPSPNTVERRRRQNRASQLAFRERNRKAMEEMREELSQSTKCNQAMYDTMYDLLQKADSLKMAIEQALAAHPRR